MNDFKFFCVRICEAKDDGTKNVGGINLLLRDKQYHSDSLAKAKFLA